jgi:hypothetical protein
MMKRLLLPALAVGALIVTGCGNDRSREDAHDVVRECTSAEPLGHCVDKEPKRVVAFHNRYSNVSEACDGYGHRIFVTTSKKFVVMPDPTCPGFIKGQEPSVIVGTPGS